MFTAELGRDTATPRRRGVAERVNGFGFLARWDFLPAVKRLMRGWRRPRMP